MRLIDADAILEKMRSSMDMQDLYLPSHFMDIVIDNMPTIDAHPVEHGQWIHEQGKCFAFRKCSKCDYSEVLVDSFARNYCPNCGARMDGESE